MDDRDAPDPDDPVPDHALRRPVSIQEDEIKGHHRDRWQHQAMYVGLHLPSRGKKRHHRHKHHHNKERSSKAPTETEPVLPSTPPSERVQHILGNTDENDIEHQTHDIFCELDELRTYGDDGAMEWKEMARWVKFEEDVEEGGERWSKPHVATLSLHSLFELRKGIVKGTVMLDTEAHNLEEITALVLDNMINSGQLGENEREKVTEILLSRHHHQHNKKDMPRTRSLADIGKNSSSKKLDRENSAGDLKKNALLRRGSEIFDSVASHLPSKSSLLRKGSRGDLNGENSNSGTDLHEHAHKFNEHFLKKIPPGSEASNILVGEADFLGQPIIAFVRLAHSVLLGDLTEVPVPTRFIFIMLGPTGQHQQYHEIGRSIATLMSDEVFHHVAYKAKHREDLLAGIDEFLDQVTVLPPGEWDPTIRIAPPKSVPSQAGRTGGSGGPGGVPNGGASADHEGEEEVHGDPTLERTGRLFGGLINDVKRRAPLYWSDIKDAMHVQCLSSFFFVYFACLSPIVTFGGLLGSATGGNMAALESLLSGAICGISYHVFAGQPLTIIGSTGPVLVFETIVYNFAADQGLDYLSFRFWIGLWVSIILFVMVMFDLSALVRYITRFTEESFALLIALIYIYEAFKKLIHIIDEYPMASYDAIKAYNESCWCEETNTTDTQLSDLNMTKPLYYFNFTEKDCEQYYGELMGPGCHHHRPNPDVFYFSCLLFIFTFVIAIYGKSFKETNFLPNKIRGVLSDFAVTIAILLMVVVDFLVGLPTPKLSVPSKFQPTLPGRAWIADPFKNPLWTIPAAIGFALLCTILIFMDQQITAVIVNRKEHKLKKGTGYHLDLLVIAIQMAICSLLGLPWFVAATVLSINHVRSLTVESETSAPGERPKFLGIREQRVTGIAVFLFVGLSVLFTTVLRLIPMPVLYGVFLYMGVSSLKGIELVQRIGCIFMPPKYQPDYIYLRHVPLRRVYFYTAIQVICLAILWTIKTIKSISIIFPLMVLAMCFVRKALEWVFTRHELKWLDDIMPESHKREKEIKKKAKKKAEEEEHALTNAPSGEDIKIQCGEVNIPLTDGKSINIAVDHITYKPHSKQIQFSEGLAKNAIFKQLAANESNPNLVQHNNSNVRQRKPTKVEGNKEDTDDGQNGKAVKFNVGPPDEETDLSQVIIEEDMEGGQPNNKAGFVNGGFKDDSRV